MRAHDHDRRSQAKVHRFKPATKLSLGGYDVDAFVNEESEEGSFDLRFELGQGLAISWGLPAAARDRMRLVLVDGAAYTVDEPVFYDDPFVANFPRVTFAGDGEPIQSVSVEVTTEPPRYQCVLPLRYRAPVELRWP
jgi:hypothetical protein